MMLYFTMYWPQAAYTNLWPFAVDQAIHIWNRIPDSKTPFSPVDICTSLLHFGNNDLQRLHVFGHPVYVLDAKLQDGEKVPKWTRCSCRGIYLGLNQLHFSTVHLVLNLETGKVSPHFHLIFNDSFSTVYSDGQFYPDVWNSLVQPNLELYIDTMSSIIDNPTIISPFFLQKKRGGRGGIMPIIIPIMIMLLIIVIMMLLFQCLEFLYLYCHLKEFLSFYLLSFCFPYHLKLREISFHSFSTTLV